MHLMQFTCKRKCITDIQSHKFNSSCDVNQVAWARFNEACILGFIVHTTRSTLLVYNITKVAVLIDLSLLLALILTVVPTTFALIWKHTGTITKSVLQPICSSRDLVRLTKLVWCREWWNPVPLHLIWEHLVKHFETWHHFVNDPPLKYMFIWINNNLFVIGFKRKEAFCPYPLLHSLLSLSILFLAYSVYPSISVEEKLVYHHKSSSE